MRVALLSNNARAGDAVGNQIAAKAAFFRDRGADLHVYVESTRRLHPTLAPLTSKATDAEQLVDELRDLDLLSVEYSQYYALLEVLPLLARGKRPRILLDYHGVTPPELWEGPAEAMRDSQRRRGLVWFADEVIVHSRFMRCELTAATQYLDERIHESPLFLETAGERSLAINWRQRLKLGDAKLLLFVGRLAANKRVPTLIEAVARHKSEHPEIHAVIVGDTGDIYRTQLEHCQALAAKLGVSERVHFLGHLCSDELGAAYRQADLFVMPSRHEGCCIPVLEAMAHGLPVVAAQAGALPETLGGAGLTFEPDNTAELADRIRLVLQPENKRPPQPGKSRIAVVSPRFGNNVLGGAERSLRLIAVALAAAGHRVEVFTTGSADSAEMRGMRVHRFPADRVNKSALAEATQAIRVNGVAESAVRAFLEQTSVSRALIASLESRQSEFDAIIVGPYANGLTCEVARRLGAKTLLMPCFHDEPLARQPLVKKAFVEVGAFLFHSRDEQDFARTVLGLSHPNSEVIGTFLDGPAGDAERGRRLTRSDLPYAVYCGRYCREKNVPELLDWIQRYEAAHPGRFRFVFAGEGQMEFPPVVTDLGYLSERDKADLIAGACVLLQPSTNESLSVVALEAWQAGVPILCRADCPVLAAHLQRCGGGQQTADFASFRVALNDLWQHPVALKRLGERGRDYVANHYSSPVAFARRIEAALAGLSTPLAEIMRQRGRERAKLFTPKVWTERFAERVDSVLHRDTPMPVIRITVTPPGDEQVFRLPAGRAKLTVNLCNKGNLPLLPDGPTEHRVWTQLFDADGEALDSPVSTCLSGIVVPGQSLRLVVNVRPLAQAGEHQIRFSVGPASAVAQEMAHLLPLSVSNTPGSAESDVDSTLAEAETLAGLPVGYTDVTEGAFAELKRKLKRKLLHQFQASYVDVLSRQQSAFNRTILKAVQELSECSAMLERTMLCNETARDDTTVSPDLPGAVRRLSRRVRVVAGKIAQLEQRLERLEKREQDANAVVSEGPV